MEPSSASMEIDRSSPSYNEKAEGKYEREDSETDLLAFYEDRAGRLVVDPHCLTRPFREARAELGDAVASKLKLTNDGTKVLWPQPSDDPEDPQNWSNHRKTVQLIVITLAAIIPDFDSGVGIAAIFALAKQYGTTTGVINNLTSKWLEYFSTWIGWDLRCDAHEAIWKAASLVLVPGFLVGCTFAPNLKTFAAMRCLTAVFSTCPQATGLYVVTDMYPFHLQARKLNVWTMGFIISPFLSPFVFGFLVARANWRWSYGVASIYGAVVVALIMFFGEETLYDRSIKPVPPRPTTGIRYRIETLLGLTGLKMAKYRPSVVSGLVSHLNVLWRPHMLVVLLFEAFLVGFAIGINVTMAVFLGTPPPVGFDWSQYATAAGYATPIVAVLIGEITSHYMNDWIQGWSIRRNKGVFEAENRLWACYIAFPLYICGFIVLGASVQNHLSAGALVMGWGISEVAVMIYTVAIYAYCNDCFPKNHGEVSSLLNLLRTLGGFSVAYFQVPWAEKHGALQVFGCEAAIVAGLFLLVVPALQLKGRYLRERFSI
ncbi:MFS general substrate transporter [Neolentinus lepideus HHB14362 ss-1]|uniref:MFS general substrate transporter n=1 Tax=Neolentinus lepideus HHB14362 ss-1 TaxID=1314782 RepID=A0A165QR85_9AGAM|nr:MFS general substrate transporter [Neolentinus lepideus HHB14362 ss-1]